MRSRHCISIIAGFFSLWLSACNPSNSVPVMNPTSPIQTVPTATSKVYSIPLNTPVSSTTRPLVTDRTTATLKMLKTVKPAQSTAIHLRQHQVEATETLRETPQTATPQPDSRIRVAVIGDYGLPGWGQESVSALVKSLNPDLVITTGDNNYPDGAAETIDFNIGQYYSEFIHPYKGSYGEGSTINRFFPSPGNHDWNTASLQPYLEYFELPGNERYYDFRWGPIHFYSIDSDSREPDGVSRDSIQASWLEEQLSTSDAPWKLIYMHHPPYSSASHGSIEWMRWPFQEWGATAVLAGHDHVYERLVIDDFPYFINGLGGTARYDFPNPLPWSQFRYQEEYGAMMIEADDEQLVFQFINHEGELIDSYVLNR